MRIQTFNKDHQLGLRTVYGFAVAWRWLVAYLDKGRNSGYQGVSRCMECLQSTVLCEGRGLCIPSFSMTALFRFLTPTTMSCELGSLVSYGQVTKTSGELAKIETHPRILSCILYPT